MAGKEEVMQNCHVSFLMQFAGNESELFQEILQKRIENRKKVEKIDPLLVELIPRVLEESGVVQGDL